MQWKSRFADDWLWDVVVWTFKDRVTEHYILFPDSCLQLINSPWLPLVHTVFSIVPQDESTEVKTSLLASLS